MTKSEAFFALKALIPQHVWDANWAITGDYGWHEYTSTFEIVHYNTNEVFTAPANQEGIKLIATQLILIYG